jgi:hypothetical protein
MVGQHFKKNAQKTPEFIRPFLYKVLAKNQFMNSEKVYEKDCKEHTLKQINYLICCELRWLNIYTNFAELQSGHSKFAEGSESNFATFYLKNLEKT